MKNLTFVVASAILVSFLAASQSAAISEPLHEVEPYSIVDTIIKAILEKMRPKFANLTISDINEVVVNPNLNATVIIKDISIRNLDKFVIQALKSNVVPLKLTNLTLTWDDVTASAYYNISVKVSTPQIKDPFNLFGEGDAKAILNNLYFTTGANVEMKDKTIQIKPKGLFGFDVRVVRADVTLTSLMGSSELGNAVGGLVSKFIPDLVDTLKKPLFDAFQDDIIWVVNQILKNGGNLFADEEPMSLLKSSESFLKNWDLNEEIGSFFKQRFDLGMEENEFKFKSEY